MLLNAERKISLPTGPSGSVSASDVLSTASGNSIFLNGGKIYFAEAVTSIALSNGVVTYTDEEGTETNLDFSSFIADVFVNGATLVNNVLRLVDNDTGSADITVDLSAYVQTLDEVLAEGSTITALRSIDLDGNNFVIESGRNALTFNPANNRIVITGLGATDGASILLDESGINFVFAGSAQMLLAGASAGPNQVIGTDENGDFGWQNRAATAPVYASDDGTQWNLAVSNAGAVSAVEVSGGSGGGSGEPGGGGEPVTNRVAVFAANATQYGLLNWAPSTQNFDIEFGFTPAGSGDRVVVGGQTYLNFMTQLKGSGEMQFFIDGTAVTSSGLSLVPGTYAEIRIRRTGNSVEFYKADTLINTQALVKDVPIGAAYPVRIGTSVDITNPFNGTIDYVRLIDPADDTNTYVATMDSDNFNNSHPGSNVANGTNQGGVTFQDAA